MRPEPSDTRSRAGRWCSRALPVLGGAVAGTAELSAYDSAATGSLRPGVGSLPLQLKSQPGVSPD